MIPHLARVGRFESLLDPQAGWPGRYINVQRCKGLSMVLLQLKDLLEVFIKKREFLPSSRFLSCRNMTQKKHSFLPYFTHIYMYIYGK